MRDKSHERPGPSENQARLKMAALESVFEESLFQASNVINLENVSVRKR